MAAGWWPPASRITHAYGFCFTADQRVVLVAEDGPYWRLPGGQVEPGGRAIDALVRGVTEEASAQVIRFRYLACQHVWAPYASAGTSGYHAVWWARVELDRWDPHHETVMRQLLAPDLVTSTLSCRSKVIAGRLLDLAGAAEHAYRAIHAT
jgi:8-oxo-dGTP pyrophosphatase MutT (NUDIX family)